MIIMMEVTLKLYTDNNNKKQYIAQCEQKETKAGVKYLIIKKEDYV